MSGFFRKKAPFPADDLNPNRAVEFFNRIRRPTTGLVPVGR